MLDYQGLHKPTGSGDLLCNLDNTFPDIYTEKGAQYYPMTNEAKSVIHATKGKPNKLVNIYRAVIDGVDRINPGDWVTTSKEYAREHLKCYIKGGRVLTLKVPAHHVRTGGDCPNEYGYFPPIKNN